MDVLAAAVRGKGYGAVNSRRAVWAHMGGFFALLDAWDHEARVVLRR